jgi:hypothetical protein
MKTPPRSPNFWPENRPIAAETFPLTGCCVGLSGGFVKTAKTARLADDRHRFGQKMFQSSSKFLKLSVTNRLGSGDR